MDEREQNVESSGLPGSVGGAAAIAAQLRKAIMGDTYAYRERLPAERDLAQHYRASRSTVRQALKQLEEGNLVVRRVGSGTFVNFRGNSGEDDIAERTSPVELIEVRIAIEPEMARLASLHATQRSLDRLAEALADVEACSGRDRKAFTRTDAAFHQAFADCTRNPLMIGFYRQINAVRSHAQWARMRDKVLSPDRQRDYNEQHRALYDAIRARDTDAAVRIVRAHLDIARNDLIGASRQ
ncbi:MAG: FadR family transcriptional regulator [Rhodospirillales bacterium]|nr:FadR family transcriptional regulator [Rhodospirillales bacterium]